MPEIDLADVEKVWQSKVAQKRIQAMYKRVADDLAKEAENLPKDGMISEVMKKNYLNQYVKSLEKEIDKIEAEVYKEVQLRMDLTAKSVVNANIHFMGRVGLDMEGAFDKVPSDVVNNLVNGKIYKGNWKFSKALWKNTKRTKKDIQTIVAEGLTKQKSTYDIAKDLEKYVNPTAKKDWDWSKVYPGTRRKVDYSAQRMARTLVQHAYQQAYRQTIKHNPFIEGVIWHSVFAEGRTCELCEQRNGTRYEKGTEPLDHPMGLCYLEPEISKSMDEIADELADWANGQDNPKIDNYVESAFGAKKGDTYQRVRASAKNAKARPYEGKIKSPAKSIVPEA